jgi:ABC-type multidrug transport system fused ATPase/permease subunit
MLALIDLLAVSLIGVIAALSISGIQSTNPNSRITDFLNIVNMQDFDLQTQVAILGLLAATLLISRTVASVVITRRTLFFLSNRGAAIASSIFAKLTSQSLPQIRTLSTQEVIYAVTSGTSAIALGVIGAFLATFADAVITVVIISGLFFLNPIMALSMLIFFGLTAGILYKLTSEHAHSLGALQASQSVAVNETVTEVLSSYRELMVKNRREYFSQKLAQNRYEFADVLARIQFLPNVSKYIIEVVIVLGVFAICTYEFLAQDANSAIAVLSVFLASATRIAPAIMRIQQGATSIKGAAGGAERTLDILKALREVEILSKTSDLPRFDHLENISFSYPGTNKPTLSNINLAIKPGDLVAIVGPSGAGKTTLIDVILGVITPDVGSVEISDLSPLQAISKWPGSVSYVPQDILITNGTVAENVAFGFPIESVPKEKISEALIFAELESFVDSLPIKTESQVGERGTKISGGQRQRLGIARAFLTRPKLLVLDEATSTLDAQTEKAISDSINSLKGSVTVIIIAHRLSTVSDANLVVYMDNGLIKAAGTLEEVRRLIPDFDLQAKLMGL